jgi:hypothetical protein
MTSDDAIVSQVWNGRARFSSQQAHDLPET